MLVLARILSVIWKYKLQVFILILISTIFITSNMISNRNKDIKNLETSLALQIAVSEQLKKDVSDIQAIKNKLANIKENSCKKQQETRKSIKKFAVVTPDNLTEVEKNLNQTMNDRTRCFELATGSKPIKGEKNSVCPDYIN